MPGRNVSVPVAALIATLAAIGYAGLAPFEFHPGNGVDWLVPPPGLHFEGPAIAHTRGALVWPEDGRELSIELWARPGGRPTHLARIFAVYDSHELPALSVDQWRGALILRNRVARNETSHREFAATDVLERGALHHLVVTSGEAGTVAYVDGAATALETQSPIVATGEHLGGQLVLGNSLRGNQAWGGEILGVAVFARTLGAEEIVQHAARSPGELRGEPGLIALYTFEEGRGGLAGSTVATGPPFEIPAEFQPLRRTILRMPDPADRRYGWYRQDLMVNVAGFVPLGFLVSLLVRRRGASRGGSVLLIVALCAGAVSLGLELTQVLLPARVSSLTDLASNVVGAVLGAGLDVALVRLRRKRPPPVEG